MAAAVGMLSTRIRAHSSLGAGSDALDVDARHVDVKDSAENVTKWDFEFASADGQLMLGWRRDSWTAGHPGIAAGFMAEHRGQGCHRA
jgi:hypothetical protein